MKNKAKAFLLTAAVLLTAAAVIAAVYPENEPDEVFSPPAEEISAEFYLRDCDGFIAVYRGDSSTPIDVTDIETATLTSTDAEKLSVGIPARSRNELLMLLEDLGS